MGARLITELQQDINAVVPTDWTAYPTEVVDADDPASPRSATSTFRRNANEKTVVGAAVSGTAEGVCIPSHAPRIAEQNELLQSYALRYRQFGISDESISLHTADLHLLRWTLWRQKQFFPKIPHIPHGTHWSTCSACGIRQFLIPN